MLAGGAVIDVGQHFVKQSWRNRCEILSAGGIPKSLTVHVAAGAQRLAMRDVRIDESKRWRHEHVQALRSAYGRAPFFEHYWGDFERIFSRRQTFLWELNHELLELMLRLLRADVTPTYSESYIENRGSNEFDFRDSISPKARLTRPDAGFRAMPYWQVFCEGGFEPNLSTIDALMCEGSAALEIIRGSAVGKGETEDEAKNRAKNEGEI